MHLHRFFRLPRIKLSLLQQTADVTFNRPKPTVRPFFFFGCAYVVEKLRDSTGYDVIATLMVTVNVRTFFFFSSAAIFLYVPWPFGTHTLVDVFKMKFS